MEPISIVTMIFVLGIVWGGLTLFISKAIKYEGIKRKNGED